MKSQSLKTLVKQNLWEGKKAPGIVLLRWLTWCSDLKFFYLVLRGGARGHAPFSVKARQTFQKTIFYGENARAEVRLLGPSLRLATGDRLRDPPLRSVFVVRL